MIDGAVQKSPAAPANTAIARSLGSRSIVLIGMMGAGKSSVGRRLAVRLGIPFVDADTEIESAAGMTIADIFAQHGETYFRAGEARVIAGIVYGTVFALATFVTYHPREIIVTIPPDKFLKQPQ
jgi:adenylate kinase family enzyme